MSRDSVPAAPADARGTSSEATERPSKSQRKRDMAALQALGVSLLQLPEATLARIDIPEDLRTAIAEATRIHSHEGRRRQRQFIGKLMRRVDADALRAAIENATGESKQVVALMHRCERLRDRLLDDDHATEDLMTMLPQADVQQVRAMIRAARREHAEGRPPKHARQLYRWLHEQLAQPAEAS